jgi:hypothetical protein
MRKQSRKPLRQIVTAAVVLTGICGTTPDVGAAPLMPAAIVAGQPLDQSLFTPVVVRRGGGAHRTTVVGPRGGAASRTVVRHGAAVRPGVRGGAVGWARPYRWPRGGAIAAGAAIGFVTAATAAAWAGAPPAPGMCWYYTDPSRTQGFWDYCR